MIKHNLTVNRAGNNNSNTTEYECHQSSLFIPFIMAGHPNFNDSIEAVIALSKLGADIIELGVPFSDPIADGPINQRAAEVALKNGTTLEKVFELVRIVRARGISTPIILFSYINPIFAYCHKNTNNFNGQYNKSDKDNYYEIFAVQAKAAGINGVIVVDLPLEEDQGFYSAMQESGLEVVLIVSPTTHTTRFKLYKKFKPNFLYYVSRLGVTGLQTSLPENFEEEFYKLKSHFPDTKIIVGFGISTVEQASQLSKMVDGVVVGSALVKVLENEGLGKFKDFASEFITKLSKRR